MNRMWTAVVTALALILGVGEASAQQEGSGFLTGGISFYQCCAWVISGGALVSVAGSPLLIGGQGDLLVAEGVALRVGPVAQLNLRRAGRVRPFVTGGHLFGGALVSQSMLGAGLDVWTRQSRRNRVTTLPRGVRIAALAGFRHLLLRTDYTATVQAGIAWRWPRS